MPSGASRRSLLRVLLLAPVATLAGCLYGFTGGGLPRDLKTVAVVPFENLTAVPEVQREVFEAVRKAMQDRLNLRDAPVERADVLVTGVIRDYEVDLPVGVTADPSQATSARRKLQLVVDYEIVNQRTGEMLREKKGASREAQYAEGAELRGRRDAIEQMVNELIDEMLSQW
ncbi:MAG TPA: LPS assembly lipoprotein LptE [Gemmatimonadaceae bacterium]|nr:LPS assembly lipoprotein LptE [Gemmatimonadaceae bacterium]